MNNRNVFLLKFVCLFALLSTIVSASDTLVLRRGLNGFPGILEASLYSKGEGGRVGGSYLKCGSGWC